MARPLSVLTLDQTQVDFPILKIVVPQIGHDVFDLYYRKRIQPLPLESAD